MSKQRHRCADPSVAVIETSDGVETQRHPWRRGWPCLAVGGSALAAQRLASQYRRDIDAANVRLASVDRRAVTTKWGVVEYAEGGAGDPLLVVHGIVHGCDGGLLSVRDLHLGYRVIAPSRFGYLGSDLPPGATPADQADAFAALLDALAIDEIDVIGISAGATSALQLAMRHPGRVKHLVVISGNLPGNAAAVAPPQPARLLYGDLPMWALKVFAPSILTRLMGVPRRLPMTDDDRRFVAEMTDSVFPVAPRAQGAIFDAYISNPDVNDYDLEAISVPCLIIHAKDDPLIDYDAARRAASRIPAARLVSLDRGGHLMLGQAASVGPQILAFLADGAAT